MSLSGEIEVDENYFGSRRKGMCVRGAAGKVRYSTYSRKSKKKSVRHCMVHILQNPMVDTFSDTFTWAPSQLSF